MTETTKAEPIPETMLDELLELTDTDRKAVARAVSILRHIQPDPQVQARLIVEGVEKVLDERNGKLKRMLQKIISSALGILKDPEL